MTAVPPAAAPQPQAHVAALLEGLPHAAWLVGLADQRVLAANGLAAQLFGCEREALVGETVLSLASSPEDLAYWAGVAPGITEALQTDTVLSLPDGRMMHACRSIRPVALVAGAPAAHVLVMLADRSAERQLETEREALLAELQATLEATADGILVTDLQGRVQAFNRRLAELWGMPAAMLLANDDAAVQAWMLRSVTEPEAYSRRLQALSQATLIVASDRLELHSGQVMERVTRPLFRAGRPQGRVWSFRDLSERVAAQERMESLSLHDSLTGLPNRRCMARHLSDAADRLQMQGGGLALLMIDLDRFRHVNDSLGHQVGDQVLLDVVPASVTPEPKTCAPVSSKR